MKAVQSCLVCQGKDFELLYETTFEGTWENAVPLFLTDREKAVHGAICRCRRCGFVFTSPQFTPDDYARIYQAVTVDNFSAGRENSRNRQFVLRKRQVQKYISGGEFLDLGCGTGFFHRMMGGYEGAGFEVRHGDGVKYQSSEKTYLGNFINFANDPEMAQKFDFVTAWDVLEHIAELDAYMKGIEKILKPGGYFICTIPNVSSLVARMSGRSWNCLLLEHLWFFSQATFKPYIERFGLELLDTGSCTLPVDFQTIANRFSQTYGGKPMKLPGFVANRVVDFPIGLMFVVSQKPASLSSK